MLSHIDTYVNTNNEKPRGIPGADLLQNLFTYAVYDVLFVPAPQRCDQDLLVPVTGQTVDHDVFGDDIYAFLQD